MIKIKAPKWQVKTCTWRCAYSPKLLDPQKTVHCDQSHTIKTPEGTDIRQ